MMTMMWKIWIKGDDYDYEDDNVDDFNLGRWVWLMIISTFWILGDDDDDDNDNDLN